ncbi:MAG TPA: hypothetical protein VG248_11575 [Caulobacteraceae bacterium]|jgi:hypothetical protein|nr:hypothetical protein [Caulobacteraceae bacterium]
MADLADQSRRLLVVLDPNFGDRLHEVRPDQPVWIVESAHNTPVVKALWRVPLGHRSLTDVTSFTPKAQDPEPELIGQLDVIDLHHGPYSTQTPYTLIEVVGARLTHEVRAAVRQLGFDTFKSTQRGFTARRSDMEAQRLRRDLV